MKNHLRFSVSCLLVFTLCSCGVYKQPTKSSFKKFSNYSCRAKQRNVFLFFDQDSVNFKYKKLGLIEASGKAIDDEKEILERFKYTAYQNCANAIISVKTETVNKNYGGDYRTEARTYVSKIYRGLAVRMESDSLYKSNKYGNSQDLSFIKNTINYNHERENKTIITAVLAILVSALFVGIYVLTAYH